MIHPLTLRALAELPAPLANKVRAHAYRAETADLISEVWISLAEASAGDSLGKIFNRARSRTREFSQDPAHYGVAIYGREDLAEGDAPVYSARVRGEASASMAAREGISRRAAQYRIKKQRERGEQGQGDLFGEAGSGVKE